MGTTLPVGTTTLSANVPWWRSESSDRLGSSVSSPVHDGSLTTLHANSARDALTRLETLMQMSGISLPDKAMREQISSAIDVIVQVSRLSDGKRKIMAISEITGMEGNVVTMQDVFTFKRTGMGENGQVMGQFVSTGIRPRFLDRLKVSGVELPPSTFD